MIKLTEVSAVSNDSTYLKGASITLNGYGLVVLQGPTSVCELFLNVISGKEKVNAGQVDVLGHPLHNYNWRKLKKFRNSSGVSMVFYEFIENESINQNITIPLKLKGVKDYQNKIDNLLQSIFKDENTEEVKNKSINSLTSIEKAKVALVRALVSNPSIILVQELKDVSLDEEKEFINLLKSLSSEHLIIYSAGNKSQIEIDCNEKIIIDENSSIKETIDTPLLPASFETKELKRASLFQSKWPWLTALKGFRHHKVALILGLIFSFISMLFFSTSYAHFFEDRMSANLRMCYDDGNSFVVLTGKYRCKIDNYFKSTGQSDHSSFLRHEYDNFSNKQIKKYIQSSNNPLIIYEPDGFYITELNNESDTYSNSFSSVIKINGKLDIDYLNLEADSRLQDKSSCHLPNTSSEIAISDEQATLFLEHGYVDKTSNSIIKIEKLDDLIGKKLTYPLTSYNLVSKTISGIFTPKNKADDMFIGCAYVYDSTASYYENMDDSGITSDQHAWSSIKQIVYKLSGNYTKDKNFIKSLTHWQKQVSDTATDRTKYLYRFDTRINSKHTSAIESRHVTIWGVWLTAAGIALLFEIAGMIFLYKFLKESYKDNQKENDVFDMMGTRKLFIHSTVYIQVLIMCVAMWLLTTLGTLIAGLIYNSVIGIPLLYPVAISVFFTLLTCIFVSFIPAWIHSGKVH